MSKNKKNQPQGLIPHLICSPCKDAIEFYKKAFGAEEVTCLKSPDGERIMHAALQLSGHTVFVADDFPEYCGGKSSTPTALGGTPVTIHRYVPDCDAALRMAEEAGAEVKMPAQDMFWGDRYGVLIDPFGHSWSVATRLRELSPEEIEQGMKEAFAQGCGNTSESE